MKLVFKRLCLNKQHRRLGCRFLATQHKQYVVGYHSAALKEEEWESIADFILTGDLNPTEDMEIADKQCKPLVWLSNIAPVVWIGIVFLVIKGALFLEALPIAEWQRTLIIWTVLTRV